MNNNFRNIYLILFSVAFVVFLFSLINLIKIKNEQKYYNQEIKK